MAVRTFVVAKGPLKSKCFLHLAVVTFITSPKPTSSILQQSSGSSDDNNEAGANLDGASSALAGVAGAAVAATTAAGGLAAVGALVDELGATVTRADLALGTAAIFVVIALLASLESR
jgi:hypothetical protein